MSETQAVFISWFLFALCGLVLGYAFYKEFSDNKNNPEYLKEYKLELNKPDLVELNKPKKTINLFEEIQAFLRTILLYVILPVFVFACLGILGYAVTIFVNQVNSFKPDSLKIMFEDKEFIRGLGITFSLCVWYYILRGWIFLICDTIHQSRIETIRELKNIQDEIGKLPK